ncbi:hypothetical protein KCP70_00820 [Salmonella enterica subsp. enterica]|nr:hypothetical protein KCP70_00820 [Salmonella enterica subsp. enterica]
MTKSSYPAWNFQARPNSGRGRPEAEQEKRADKRAGSRSDGDFFHYRLQQVLKRRHRCA